MDFYKVYSKIIEETTKNDSLFQATKELIQNTKITELQKAQLLLQYQIETTNNIINTSQMTAVNLVKLPNETALVTAQTKATEADIKLKTAQTDATEADIKLKTAQTDAIEADVKLKTAQSGAIEADKDYKKQQKIELEKSNRLNAIIKSADIQSNFISGVAANLVPEATMYANFYNNIKAINEEAGVKNIPPVKTDTTAYSQNPETGEVIKPTAEENTDISDFKDVADPENY